MEDEALDAMAMDFQRACDEGCVKIIEASWIKGISIEWIGSWLINSQQR